MSDTIHDPPLRTDPASRLGSRDISDAITGDNERITTPKHCGNGAAGKNDNKKNDNDCCRDDDDDDDDASTTEGVDSRFSCNICFDEVSEPVVTTCGHLYCWPCLFRWLEPGMTPEERESLGMSAFRLGGTDSARRVCPVCKKGCPLSAVVPVYVRSSPSSRSRRRKPAFNAEEDSANRNNSTGEERRSSGNNTSDDRVGTAEGGLRQRRRNQAPEESSSYNGTNEGSENFPVPNRPSVTYPQHQQAEPSSPPVSRRSSPGSAQRRVSDNPYRVGGVQLTPRSPNGHNGSLTYGILSSLQRATADYYRNGSPNASPNPSQNDQERQRIPSLHNRRSPSGNHNDDGSGRFEAYPQSDQPYGESNGLLNSETTHYLSRLLIMLTSFVIFCFLLV